MRRRIEIGNFRSIERAEVDVAPFTVIVGRNGSGKSNLADAFVFLREFLTNPAMAIESRGGFNAIRRRSQLGAEEISLDLRVDEGGATPWVYRWKLVLGSDELDGWRIVEERVEAWNEFAVRGAAGTVTGTMEKRTDAVLEPTQSLARVLDEDVLAIIVGAREPIRFRPEPSKMRAPQTIGLFDSGLGEDGSRIGAAVRAARAGARWPLIMNVMSRVVPNLVDIDVETALNRYSFLKFAQANATGHRWDCAAADMSDGALRTLALLLSIEHRGEFDLLVVEEPETAIHPGAARLLFEVLKEASTHCSVLVTTHSPDLLDAAQDEEILVCELVDGITQVGPLANAQREVVRQGLFSLSELIRSEPLRIEGRDSKPLDPSQVDP